MNPSSVREARIALVLATLAFLTCFYAWSLERVFSALPLAALAAWHQGYAQLLALGFLLGVAGSSFAVGVELVGLEKRAAGAGGHVVLDGRTCPRARSSTLPGLRILAGPLRAPGA